MASPSEARTMDKDRLGGGPWVTAPIGRLPGDAAPKWQSATRPADPRASPARKLLLYLLGCGAVVLVVEIAVALGWLW
jgi:hypothetical protein